MISQQRSNFLGGPSTQVRYQKALGRKLSTECQTESFQIDKLDENSDSIATNFINIINKKLWQAASPCKNYVQYGGECAVRWKHTISTEEHISSTNAWHTISMDAQYGSVTLLVRTRVCSLGAAKLPIGLLVVVFIWENDFLQTILL